MGKWRVKTLNQGGEGVNDVLGLTQQHKTRHLLKNLPVNLHTPFFGWSCSTVIQLYTVEPGSHTPDFHLFVPFKYPEEVYFFVKCTYTVRFCFSPTLPFLYPLFN